MARIEGVPRERAGWMVRIAYWFARKKVGAVPDPLTIYAHNPWVMRAYGAFEMGAERASTVPLKLKSLASVKTGSLVGCRW